MTTLLLAETAAGALAPATAKALTAAKEIGGAFAKELLNAGFTTPKEIEDLLELPLLSSVATMAASDLTIAGKDIQIPQYPVIKPLSRFS